MKQDVSLRHVVTFGLPVLGLLIAVAAYFMMVSPQKSKASHLSDQISEAQLALAAVKPKQALPKSIGAADLFRLTKAMPDTDDMPGILLDLSRVAHATHVSITSVNPSPDLPGALGYGSLPMNVIVNGKFADVSRFLGRLRKQVYTTANGNVHADGRLIVASNVQLNSSDGKTVAATVTLNAFVFGVAAPAAPPSTSTDTTATTTTATTTSSG